MEKIEKLLKERKENNLLRVLSPRNEGLDFSSNDYLGLSNHPRLKEAARIAVDKFGTGSSASRLLSGDTPLHHELEDKAARFKGKESALLFNSGYQANVGIISALLGKGDAIFSDKLNHASIIDGMLLSGADIFRFHHNDSVHLEFLLEKHARRFRNCLIVTETVFSMDGDLAPIGELVKLKEKYNCRIMVDEAHATGIFGKNGTGMAEESVMTERIDFIMGTFSKALGSFGAYLACSEQVKSYLINTCRSFIYSTSLPPSVIAANIESLELVQEEHFRRKELLQNADYFRNELKGLGLEVRGSSQIVPLILGESEKAITLSTRLQERGYRVLPIRPPTVPAGEARLRFSLNYEHSKEMLGELIDVISNINTRLGY